ncbi:MULTISPECIES: AraC family transcriptional regulator N-terminal domain-containing protein [Roseobacteraceae]|uniref:AraC family transcriptional regulator N-terminal domain-containing protein n=1 Tax=Roseobacteraceae TaxID=2854170 RepID=UPI00405882DB
MSEQIRIETPNAGIRARQAELAAIIDPWTVGKEDYATALPNLGLFRRESTSEPHACMIEPSIIIVCQGVKQMHIGARGLTYDSERFLVASLDLPGDSRVLEASPDRPCLGLVLRLDLRLIAELSTQVRSAPAQQHSMEPSAAIGQLTPELLAPFARLVALLDEPEAIPVLAPLIEREIHYRLLQSDQAPRLLRMVSVGSQSHRIARAIDWLKTHYAEPLKVEELAAQIHMSPSSLHHHFRQLTAMSPLQYQKRLRLNEARRLMLTDDFDAAGAAFNVGYESPSQFSREYSRLFGAPPRRDIERIRDRATAPQALA